MFLDLTKYSYCKTAYAASTGELIRNAEMQLIGQSIEFDSMVGIGNSGLLVMPILARHFKVPFFAMRKSGVFHHNSKQPHGDGIIGQRWILIDDVTITGNSIRYVKSIVDKLAEANDFHTEYAGTYLYEPINPVPGEFIYPDGRKHSVQQVESDGVSYYVSSGMYAKVRELMELNPSDDSCTLISKIADRFPSWNPDMISMIYTTLKKDSLCC